MCTLRIQQRYKLGCAPNEYSDQPAHPRSLVRVFDGRTIASKGSNVSSDGKLRLWSDIVDIQTDLNFHCSHMPTCTLGWILGHIMFSLCDLLSAFLLI